MGTVFSIDVRSPGVAASAVEEVIGWLHWVDRTFSTYQEASPVSRLGRGEIELRDCAPEVAEILRRCDELEAETDGYFSARADGSLDPSGLVKGWAIQRASEMLSAAGSINHCVNGGGDVQCAGSAAPGQAWRIGLADPLVAGRLVGVVAGTDLAVATSGSAERGAHIVDPHTRSRPTALASVSLAGRQLADIDAYATAVFAMGERAPAWIEAHPDLRGFIVYPSGEQWRSSNFAGDAAYTASAPPVFQAE